MRILDYGDAALLVDVGDLDSVLRLYELLTADAAGAAASPGGRRRVLPEGVLDVVPAETTVLLRCDPRRRDLAEVLARLRRQLQALQSDPSTAVASRADPEGGGGSEGPVPPVPPESSESSERRECPERSEGRGSPERRSVGTASAGATALVIDVRYDGADLEEIGDRTGLGAIGVVAAHTATCWRVAFGGFVPGFGYLVGGDPRLVVPRRGRPRERVPAGAVALAGRYCGIYPRSSPGGWQLLGMTDAPLWDADREPPALLWPGRRVRFRAVDR